MVSHAKFLQESPASGSRGVRMRETPPQSRVDAPRLVLPGGTGAPSGTGGAEKVQTLQRLAGNQAVMRMLDVQRATADLREPSDEAIRAAAAEGVRTPSTSLPYLDRIQASFGRHSIGDIQAHVGPVATRASRAMSAQAYATGNHVVFGARPDLRTAAHEAAHVVQQRAGVQLAGSISRAGDMYERHADTVADAVVTGRSVVEGLLDEFPNAADSVQRNIRPAGDVSPIQTNDLEVSPQFPAPSWSVRRSAPNSPAGIQYWPVHRVTIQGAPISESRKTWLWSETRDHIVRNYMRPPRGEKQVFLDWLERNNKDYTNVGELVDGVGDLAKDFLATNIKNMNDLKLTRPTWLKEIKALAEPGQEIRHIVRNDKLKKKIVQEWEHHIKSHPDNDTAVLEAMKKIGEKVGVQYLDKFKTSYDLVRAIYKKVYLHAGNLFVGAGGINEVIGLAADLIEGLGNQMNEDVELNQQMGSLKPQLIDTGVDGVFDTVWKVVNDKYTMVADRIKARAKDPETLARFWRGFNDFWDELEDYLYELEDEFENRIETIRAAYATEVISLAQDFIKKDSKNELPDLRDLRSIDRGFSRLRDWASGDDRFKSINDKWRDFGKSVTEVEEELAEELMDIGANFGFDLPPTEKSNKDKDSDMDTLLKTEMALREYKPGSQQDKDLGDILKDFLSVTRSVFPRQTTKPNEKKPKPS